MKHKFWCVLALAWTCLSGLAQTNTFGWGEEPVEELSDRRGRICLNGIWQFQPAEGAPAQTPVDEWGSIRVPGSWQTCDDLQSVLTKGNSGAWEFFGDKTARVWYERDLDIPASWAGRAVLLDLRRVSTDAAVFVNGVACGQVRWPAGLVDITAQVKAGHKARLRLLVVAAGDERKVDGLLAGQAAAEADAKLDSRGIIGEVFLTSRPSGAHVGDVFVQTSTRQQTLAAMLELENVPQAGAATVTARLFNEHGVLEKTFSTNLMLAVGRSKVSTAWFWPEARRWDLDQPNLYTLKLAVRGAGLDDEYAQVLGFREFWIEGRKFYLNGTEIRLRPTTIPHEGYSNMGGSVLGMDGVLEGIRQAGFNFAQHWPVDHDVRGTVLFRELWAERASQKGLLIAGCALDMSPYIQNKDKVVLGWRADGAADRYRSRMADELRRYRNYPAIVMWGTTPNFFENRQDQNPRYLGRANYMADGEFLDRAASGREAIRWIKAVDPTRPVFTHNGSEVGDVYTVNTYLNFIPLQEREEWLSVWATNGDLPYLAIEFGTPLHSSFMRGRDGFGSSISSEPFMTEYAAMYLGPEAYRQESDGYRREIAARFVGGQKYEGWFANALLEGAPAFQSIQSLFIRNTWRSWRTWGITGGMVPWHLYHGWEFNPRAEEEELAPPLQPGQRGSYRPQLRKGYLHYLAPEGASVIRSSAHTLMSVNQPTLAWVAGPPGHFTDKDHSYFAGETVGKQAVLLNDERTPQSFIAKWYVELYGPQISLLASGEQQGQLPPAGTGFVPINFKLPDQLDQEKVNVRIVLQAIIGGKSHQDMFDLRAFRHPANGAREIAVFDPVGETATMLREFGCTITPVRPDSKLIVVGRKVLSKGNALPFDLAASLRGGTRVLIMAQNPEWMRHALSLRPAPFVSRRVFPVNANEPLTAGLDEQDLRDWNGVSRLVEPYPDFPGFEETPLYGWHWGNRGGVSSAPVEKPHRGSWRPRLECEFDLAYSPLLEMEYGAGRLTLCTLDLEDHVANDPVARLLAQRVLDNFRQAEIQPKSWKVALLGDEADAKSMEFLGVEFQRMDRVMPEVDLLIIGAQAKFDGPQLDEFLQRGGRALFLRREGEGRRSVADFSGSLHPPDWPEAAGLGISDLRWRSLQPAWLMTSAGGLELGADGLLARKRVGSGVAIYCQVAPESLPADKLTYLRLTRWRQTRVLSQLLANLGATFRQDHEIVKLLQNPESPVLLTGEWEGQLTQRIPEGPMRRYSKDPGISARARELVQPQIAVSGWENHPVPATMESYGGAWRDADGEAVFRKTVDVPADWAGRDLQLSLGLIAQGDHTFFDGQLIGQTRSWTDSRSYIVPGKSVKAGANTIAVRIFNECLRGGLVGVPEELFLKPKQPDPGFYHPDYLNDRKMGDDPYRYYRW